MTTYLKNTACLCIFAYAAVLSIFSCTGKLNEKISVEDFSRKIDIETISKSRAYILPRPSALGKLLSDAKFKYPALPAFNQINDYKGTVKTAMNLGMRSAYGIYLLQAQPQGSIPDEIGKTINDLAVRVGIRKHLENEFAALDKARSTKDYKNISDNIDQIFINIELKLRQEEMKELAVAVSLGGWIEGLNIITLGLTESFNAGTAQYVLCQSEIVQAYIVSLEDNFKDMTKKDPLLAPVYHTLKNKVLPEILRLENKSAAADEIKESVSRLTDSAKELKALVEKQDA